MDPLSAILTGLGTGVGSSFLNALFGGDDSSSSSASSGDYLEASKYGSKLNLLGTLASALASSQKTESSQGADVDFGQKADAPSLGSSSGSSFTNPFSNQYKSSNYDLANALRSLLGQYNA